MHFRLSLIPSLWLASSCVDVAAPLSTDSTVTAGGASATTPLVPMTGGTGTTSVAGASSAGAASTGLPSSTTTGMAGGPAVGNAGSPSAGAAGQNTVPDVSAAGAASGAAGMGTVAGASAGGTGAGGAASGAGGDGLGGSGGSGGAETGGAGGSGDLIALAEGFHELFMHDACTGVEPSQPDTCLHEQLLEESFTFGDAVPGTYAVTLRVRGLFEPTTISGGETPLPEHPYFRVGGTPSAVDYSQWHIVISDPPQTYWLNHYPSTSHTIYKEDFEAVLEVAAGASVQVRVVDGNDRQIDNAAEELSDRRQVIEGVTDEVLDGQVLRLDVVDVVPL